MAASVDNSLPYLSTVCIVLCTDPQKLGQKSNDWEVGIFDGR